MKRTLKITSKGQVTLRREVRISLGRALAIESSSSLSLLAASKSDGRMRGKFRAFVSCLKTVGGPTFSIEDIDRTAREGWAGER